MQRRGRTRSQKIAGRMSECVVAGDGFESPLVPIAGIKPGLHYGAVEGKAQLRADRYSEATLLSVTSGPPPHTGEPG